MLQIKDYEIHKLYDEGVSYKDCIVLDSLKEGEKISILSDSMMKTMFQNTNRLKYSIKLLSYFLDIPYEELLENTILVKNELDKDKESMKSRRSDYVANIHDSIVNMEVNNNGSLETLERNMEYAHRLYGGKIKRKNRKVIYTQVIQLNLNNFSFIGNDKIVDIYYIQNDEKIKLSDKLIFIQIYIPNLIRKWYTVGVQKLKEEERYLLGLVLKNKEQSLEIGKGIEIMEEYVEEASYASLDDGLLEAYDKEWAMKDLGIQQGIEEGKAQGLEIGKVQGIEEGKAQGLEIGKAQGLEIGKAQGLEIGKAQGLEIGKAQGIEEGKAQEKLELAKKMQKENIDIDVIERITGLSKEQIEKK